MFVDEADEAEQFEERVLKWGGREQQFVFLGERLLQNVGDDIGRLVNIPQAVGFVDDDEIPRGVGDIGCLVAGELVGTDDEGVVYLERAEAAGTDGGVVGFGLKNGAREEEFFGNLLMPLLAEVGRRDDEDASFALGPLLGNDEARLDGFAETDLVGEESALG